AVEGSASVRRLLAASLRLTAAVTVPVALGGMLLARPIVVKLLGPEYAASVAPLSILVWVVPVLTFGGHFRNALIASNHVRLDLICVAGSAAINVALTLILTASFGLRGAAAAFVVAEAGLATGAYFAVRRMR